MIAQYREWEPGAVAQIFDRRVRDIEEQSLRNFSELGIIGKEMDDRKLWQYVTKKDGERCHSWDDWVQDALTVSRSTAYSARKVAQRLSGIPQEDRALISPGNLKTMAEIDDVKLTGSRPILDAAKKLKPEKFREYIEKEHPERHIEALAPMRFSPEKSAREVIDRALEIAMVMEECGREAALEAISQFYIDENLYDYNERQRSTKDLRVQ